MIKPRALCTRPSEGLCEIMSENDVPTKLLWVDLEMTGLDPVKQRIIEVAAVITDFNLEEAARYEAIIHQPDEVLDNAEQWPKDNMSELFDAVRRSEKDEETVVGELLGLIQAHFGEEKAVLAGNSIHQDRRFIRQWWPKLEEVLHYRMLDVSSFKIWMQGALNKEFVKEENHRALGDIEESIIELKWCLEQLSANDD